MKFLTENNFYRKKHLPVRGKALPLPIYFPSISSIKTNLSPFNYFKILTALQHPHFLVSAYDVANSFVKEEFIKSLSDNYQKDGSIILMDSANYESFWLRDSKWDLNSFNSILKENICDLAFCFDNQYPPKEVVSNAEWITNSIKSSQSVSLKSTVIPIIHFDQNNIINSITELRKSISCFMISIPERLLGNGLLERVATITKLRKELNKSDDYTYIHVLGTGNPQALLLLSLAGADSFDGLEWCQTVVNSKNSSLYHFQHRELILDDCEFCKRTDLDYATTTLGHNLLFYNNWMKKIQDSISQNNTENLLNDFFNQDIISKLKKIWA